MPDSSTSGASENVGLYAGDLPFHRRVVVRVRRNIRLIRTWGLRNVIDEKDADPIDRVRRAVRKWRWRRRHPVEPGSATPIYLVGVQRSGTNMMTKGLAGTPEVEVHNENDRQAFQFFQLRADEVVAEIIEQSSHQFVLLKPLCDSHRVDALLDDLPTAQPGRAIWAFRGVDGRVRSALLHSGTADLDLIRDFVAGRADHRWGVQRLSDDTVTFLRSLDADHLTPACGAALFWYIRNRLYFDLGLHDRPDVFLASYDGFVADPQRSMRVLCAFLDLDYRPSLVKHVAARKAAWTEPIDIDARVRERCDELERRAGRGLRAEGRARRGPDLTPVTPEHRRSRRGSHRPRVGHASRASPP